MVIVSCLPHTILFHSSADGELMKFFKQPLRTILLLSILFLLLTANAYAQTVYDWTGATSTDWMTPSNWSVNGVSQTVNYPGTSATDIADIGVNVSCNGKFQPVISSSESINIGALNLGDNLTPVNTFYEILFKINGTLTITGALTQKHSTVGSAGSASTAVTHPIYNYLYGTGSITCATFNVGDSTVPAANNVVNATTLKLGTTGAAGSTLNVTVTGNFNVNSTGTKDASNNIISESFGEFSFSAGTLNIYGQIVLSDISAPYTTTSPASVYSPLAWFSCDLYKNSDSPVLNLYNANPVSIQTGSNRNNIDFYNVTTNGSGGTGTITVNYASTGSTQDVPIYISGSTQYNFVDHQYTLKNMIATTSGLAGGSGYVNGTYVNVPLTGGTGGGATATIVVSGGAVTSVVISSVAGGGYTAGDILSASNTNLGGSGSGFTINVATVNASTLLNGVYQNLTYSGSGTKSVTPVNAPLSIIGNFALTGGTADFSTHNPNVTIYGNLSTASGTTLTKNTSSTNNLTINGTTTNGGTFNHSSGSTVTFTGPFSNTSTGTYNQSGTGAVIASNTTTNSGTYNQSNTGTATFNGAFNSTSTGIYNHSGSGAFTAASTTSNAGTFNQSSATVATFTGAVTSTGSINQTGSGNILFSSTFANSGSSSVFSQTSAATTTFTGAATNDGTISQNNSSGVLQFNNTFSNTASGANFTLTNGTTNFTNSYSNVGTFKQTGGTVNLVQPTSQSLADNSTGGTTFSNVNVKNGGTITMSGSGKGQFYISDTGLLNMSNNTTLATGGVLTISSDSNGSGTVTAIPSGCQITGNVTVQRYVSANRAYRLMSSPVHIATDGNGNNYYGVNYLLTNTVLTGTSFPNNGVSSKSGNPTLYLWRENLIPKYTTFLNSNFIGIADITNPASYVMNDATYTNADIPVGNGYLFYFRGSIKQSNISALTTPGAAATTDTLNAVGTINYGNITVHPWYQPTSSNLGWSTVDAGDASVQGFNLVGNPYPSSIDWDQFSSTNSSAAIYGPNVSGFSYQLIPNGLQGAGQYNVYLAGSGKVGTQGTANSNIIASGEGFMVQAINASAALTFTESAKTNTLNTGANLYMGKPVATNNFQYLRLQLTLDTINSDGTIIRFVSSAKPTFDPSEDAHYKTGTGKVSLASLSSDNVPIAYNQLPLALKGDTIHLKVGANASGTYKINVKELVGIPQLYNVFLADALTKDTTDLRKTTSYSFTVNTADTATLGSHRFTLIINQNPLLEYKLLTFTADQVGQSKHVQLAWTTVNEQNYTHFTIERSNDNGKTFNVAGGLVSTGAGQYGLVDKNAQDGDNLYRLKQVDFNNNTTYSGVIHVRITERGNKDHFTCFPNPAISTINLSFVPKSQNKTTYDLKISNSSGIVVKYAVLTDTSWQGNVSSFMTGSYLIQVTDRNDNSIIGQAKFVKL